MKDEILFKEYMTGLGEIHGKEISDTIKNIYWKTLKPFSDEECQRAFEIIIQKSRFFPKPVDFLEILQVEEADGDRAAIAWGEVMSRLQSDPYNPTSWHDNMIPDCINRLGGWDHLCRSTTKELAWIEKRFAELYKALSRREPFPQIEGGKIRLLVDNTLK